MEMEVNRKIATNEHITLLVIFFHPISVKKFAIEPLHVKIQDMMCGDQIFDIHYSCACIGMEALYKKLHIL